MLGLTVVRRTNGPENRLLKDRESLGLIGQHEGVYRVAEIRVVPLMTIRERLDVGLEIRLEIREPSFGAPFDGRGSALAPLLHGGDVPPEQREATNTDARQGESNADDRPSLGRQGPLRCPRTNRSQLTGNSPRPARSRAP